MDPAASELEIGATVVQARARASVAADAQRRVRFRGGISDFTNATSPPLRGSFGDGSAPAFTAFRARDADNADTAYGAFDELLIEM